MRVGLYAFMFLALMAAASACPDINSRTTQGFFNEIDDIDSQLDTCPIPLPRSLGFLLGDGNTVFNVQMNDGSLMSGTMTIQNNQITGMSSGGSVCRYQLTTTQDVLDNVLQSNSKGTAALYWFSNKGLRLNGCTFWTRFKSAVTKPVGRFFAGQAAPSQPTSALSGKPEYCDETYMQGHQGYAQNKALWDSYSSDTDGVCQSQYGRGAPQGCVHSVQLSVSGNPYYLCWYNN